MNDDPIRTLRFFISCPGDVGRQRQIAERVIDGLGSEFSGSVKLERRTWEYEPGAITADYEERMPRPSDFDILICILWTRLGARPGSNYMLPPDFKQAARSGTEFELVDARLRYEAEGIPDILVWYNRDAANPDVRTEDCVQRANQREQLLAFLDEWTMDANENVFIGAMNSYDSLENFEEKLEVKLRNLIEVRVGKPPSLARSRPRLQGNPYRGLRVFGRQHAALFFGRTKMIGAATDRLMSRLATAWRRLKSNALAADEPAFLLILGASGTGKSSLARAGILPMIVSGNAVEGVGLWRCAIMKPLSDATGTSGLMRALANALVREAGTTEIDGGAGEPEVWPRGLPELLAGGRTVEMIVERLKKQPECLGEMVVGGLSTAAEVFRNQEDHILVGKIAEHHRSGRTADAAALEERRKELLVPRRACLAVLIDQLEELFLNGPAAEEVTDRWAEKDIRQFLKAIEALAATGWAVVIATLRSDFYPQCAAYPELLRLKDGLGSIQLGAPEPDELAQMIRKPAQAAGVIFEENEKGSLNDRLRKEADATDNPDSLPLLEFCLEKLYDLCKDKGVIDHRTYERIGQLEGVLTRHADEILDELKKCDAQTDAGEWHSSLRRVIEALATVSESGEGREENVRLVRRIVRYENLADTPLTKSLVDAFIKNRLFTADINAAGEKLVGVTHEALLRNWNSAKEWLRKEETLLRLRTRAHVEQRLAAWKESKEDRSYLLQPGLELETARGQFEKNPTSFQSDARDFIILSIAVAAEEKFRACIQAGGEEEMLTCSAEMERTFPKSRLAVLTGVLRDEGNAITRRNGALLLGRVASTDELTTELIRLVVSDPEEPVRRAAAYSLTRLDRIDLYNRVAEIASRPDLQSAALGALARILVSAEMDVQAPRFDAWFQAQPKFLKNRVRRQSRWLRLKMAIPIFFAITVPATVLAVISSMLFKWLPGCLNYAYGQARPSPFVSLFHAATAAIFIAGIGSLGLTFYRMVLGREHGRCDSFHPFGAVVAGAVAGGIGGLFCTMAIATVFTAENLWIMGWVNKPEDIRNFGLFMNQIFHQNLCGLIFVLNGMGTGIGMALMTNRLRNSGAWKEFLNAQSTSSLGNIKKAFPLLGGLIKLAAPQCWPLPIALLVTSIIGLILLAGVGMRPTPDKFAPASPPFVKKLPGGEAYELEFLQMREWKTGLYGRAFGIAGDSTAMAIGGFFAVVGIGLGIIILRSGVSVEPRRRNG